MFSGLQDIRLPSIGPDEILVRVKSAGVNPVDTYLRSGAQGYDDDLYPIHRESMRPVWWRQIGENVSGVSHREAVFSYMAHVSGTYAEECICTPRIRFFPFLNR